MAKQDLKQYVEKRITTLLLDLQYAEMTESLMIQSSIRELLDLASQFEIKTKDALNSHPLGNKFKK